MKVNLNVFPNHYRCEPRDYKAIFFVIVAVFISIILISTYSIFKRVQFSRFEQQSRAPVEALQARREGLLREKQNKETEIKRLSFDENLKVDLNEEIKAFNQIMRDFYWSVFFQELEENTPDNIWIKNMIIEELPHVVLKCEAEDLFKPVEFVKKLELSDYFENILLGRSEENLETKAITFNLSFKVKTDAF
ncbi:MAG: PilN domain-containing protein [Candidatus Muiribacteriota bacterium]